MQHIVNIAFDFDDEKVKNIAEKRIEYELDTIIEDIILDHIAPRSKGWKNEWLPRDWTNFNNRTDEIVKEFLASNREEIIERAATKLARSTRQTKAWKEQTQVTCYE